MNEPTTQEKAARGLDSATQVRIAIAAVASSMCEFVTEASLNRLAQSLTGERRDFMMAANTHARTCVSSTGSSLVMNVAGCLPQGSPAHACAVVRIILAELAPDAVPSEVRDIVAEMPARLRKLWPASVWNAANVALAA